MVTRFNRRGHYRTNASGTRSYVRPHEVEKEYFSIEDSSGQLLINGKARLKETRCRHCYNKVYHAALSTTKNIYFNNDKEPLIKHVCLKPEARVVEREGILKKPKKFLSDSEIAAQEKRERLLKNSNQIEKKRTVKSASGYLAEAGAKKLLKDIAEIKERIRKTKAQLNGLEKNLNSDPSIRKNYDVTKRRLGEQRDLLQKKIDLVNRIKLGNEGDQTKPELKGHHLPARDAKDIRPTPNLEEKKGIQKRIRELNEQISQEIKKDNLIFLQIDKLKNEQFLAETWTEYMELREKIIALKKESENFVGHTENLSDLKDRLSQYKASISFLSAAVKRENDNAAKSRLNKQIAKKNKAFQDLRVLIRKIEKKSKTAEKTKKLEVNQLILEIESAKSLDLKISKLKKTIKAFHSDIATIAIEKAKNNNKDFEKYLEEKKTDLAHIKKHFADLL